MPNELIYLKLFTALYAAADKNPPTYGSGRVTITSRKEIYDE